MHILICTSARFTIRRHSGYETPLRLFPPELRRYFYTKTNSQRLGKDDLLALAQYGLVCCEELEQELIVLYFRKPSETEHGQFMPTARILQHIGCNLTQQLNAVNIGRALTELGFEQKTYQHVRGFIVVPRNGDEMAGFQKTLAIQALPDSV